jgi:HlyD family secretion protein
MIKARIVAVAAAVLVGGGTGLALSPISRGNAATASTAVAAVGDIVATVGGVGRAVDARALAPISVPTATPGAAGGAPSGSGSAAPAGAVFATASGRIAKLAVTIGQQVAAGDTLAEIDDGGAAGLAVQQASTELATARLELLQKQISDPATGIRANPSEVAAAQLAVTVAAQKLALVTAPPSQIDVTAARGELKKAQADQETLRHADPPASSTALAAAQYAVDLANLKLAQVTGPSSPNLVSAAELEVKRAQADLDVLGRRGGPAGANDISIARLKVQAVEARLAGAKRMQDRLAVHAPSGGTVTALLTTVGGPADVSTPIATVIDLQHLMATVDLSEFDAAQAKTGQRAVVTVDALGGKQFAGTVIAEALAGVESGGVVSFPVRVAVTDFGGVKPGMSVSVRVVVAERRNVVKVPLEAIIRLGGDNTVTIVDAGGRQTNKKVTLGQADNKEVEVVQGLHAGERVILGGAKGG